MFRKNIKMNNLYDESRAKNTVLNMFWAILNQAVTVLLGFISRKIFLCYLGAELLGVNGLFSDVLLLFSFADLGFGTAIMFSMYTPIAENDTEKIKSLLCFYRKIYKYVIMSIIIISIAFIPALNSLKTDIPFENLIVYYLFFQFSNIVEYIWVYRENYVIACQKERELSIFNLLYVIIKNVTQIVTLILFKDFIAFLIIGLICSIGKKIIVNRYIIKKYPVTILHDARDISVGEKKILIKKATALFITKIGNLIINQTDSIIVSYFISVTQWGIASNYLLIKKALFAITDKIYNAVLPSMGNLVATSDKKHQIRIFLKYDFYNAWIQIAFFNVFLCLGNPFMELFFGADITMNNSFVFVFALASFVDGLRAPVSLMREATGTFEKDKWYTILAAIINILVSIPLAIIYGINGVYIGTISAMIVLHITRSLVLLKDREYGVSYCTYLGVIIKNIICCLLIGLVTYNISKVVDLLEYNNFVVFIIKCILAGILPSILWILINLKNQYLKEGYIKVKNYIKNKRI